MSFAERCFSDAPGDRSSHQLCEDLKVRIRELESELAAVKRGEGFYGRLAAKAVQERGAAEAKRDALRVELASELEHTDSLRLGLSEYAAHVERLRTSLMIVLESAYPHPTEHPTMTSAWDVGRATLAATPAQSLATVRAAELRRVATWIRDDDMLGSELHARTIERMAEKIEKEAANA